MRTILWLSEISIQDGPHVGGKALCLASIAQAGFPVLPGFCVTTAAYQQFMAANRLEKRIQAVLSAAASEIETASTRLREAILVSQMSMEVQTAIRSAFQELAVSAGLTHPSVAVRSSASAEDLPTASFAGQQATFLGVCDEEQLLYAIRECWASLWSPRAIQYRAERCSVQELPLIAVLVQRMVNAEFAGVAFSVDAVTGEEHIIIEAAWGLGETVVAGREDVDRYVVSRKTCTEIAPPFIAKKLRKRIMTVQGGLQTAEVPVEARDVRVLTPEQVRQVAEVVLALEQHFGCPQDMEWAFAEGQIFILQTRPITTQVSSFFTDMLPKDDDIWTAGFLNERFLLPVSPLGWSLIRELLEELAFRDPLRYLGLKHTEQLRITKLYRGHPYVNMFVFQTLYKVFPAFLLPEDACRYFPDGKTELRLQVKYPLGLGDPRFLFSMLRHFVQQPSVWSPWHNYRVWAAFAVQHERCHQRLEEKLHMLRDGMGTEQDIWMAIDQAQKLNAKLLALHRWSLTCADLTYTLLRRLLQSYTGSEEAARLCASLVTALPNKSMEVDCALRELAQMQNTPVFAQVLADFLAQYGHRSFHLDIYYPPFAADPTQVLHLLMTLSRCDDKPLTEEERVAIREQAEQEACQLMSGGLLGWLRRALFEHVLHLAQCYMPLREEQRFYWQKTLALQRNLFLLLGQRMVEAGALREHTHVFFLTKDEIKAYMQGHVNAERCAEWAALRKQQFVFLQQEFDVAPTWSYPPFLRGNRPLGIGRQAHAAQFQGRAISPGLARGRAIVIFSPAEFDRIQLGDVLVTRAVDPGWTPIFGLLSALVMEQGGQLSHGAVVAREYGLPTVAGIPGITQSLHDGDMVVVDGLNGLVAKEADNRTENC